MIRVLLIRHFATDWNEQGRLQGRVDRPLSEVGRNFGGDKVLPPDWQGKPAIVSPLQRAQETAQLIGLTDFITDDRLIEMHMGDYEGAVIKTMRREFGQAFLDNEDRGLDYQPPGGESPRMVQDRVLPVLAECREDSILVCHKGVIRSLLASAWQWDMRGKPPHKPDFRDAMVIGLDDEGRPATWVGNVPWGRVVNE